MKLVADARNWWKWHSTYVFGVLAIFPMVWLNSPELQALLPAALVSKIAPIIGVIGFLLRIRAQLPKPPKSDPSDGAGA